MLHSCSRVLTECRDISHLVLSRCFISYWRSKRETNRHEFYDVLLRTGCWALDHLKCESIWFVVWYSYLQLLQSFRAVFHCVRRKMWYFDVVLKNGLSIMASEHWKSCEFRRWNFSLKFKSVTDVKTRKALLVFWSSFWLSFKFKQSICRVKMGVMKKQLLKIMWVLM